MEENKSGKKDLIIIVFVLLVIAGLVYYFVDKSKKDKAYKEAVEHLHTKYNININDFSIDTVKLKHKVPWCSEYCIEGASSTIMPTYVRIKYNNKIVTVIDGKDDLLVTELYEGIREHYADILNISKERVFVSIISKDYDIESSIGYNYNFAKYLIKYHITSMDKTVVNDFLSRVAKDYNIRIFLNAEKEELDDFERFSNDLYSYEYLLVYDNSFHFTSSCILGEYKHLTGEPTDQMYMSCKINELAEYSSKYEPIFRKYGKDNY